jgi:rod shape-determining protein MreD
MSKLTRVSILFLVFFVALILQTTILPILQVDGMIPDLLLVLIIFFALFTGSFWGVVIALTVGLVEDLVGARYLGLSALAGFLIAYLVGYLEGMVYKDNFLLPLLLVFAGTYLFNSIFLLGQGVGGTFPDIVLAWRSMLPEAIYNTVLAALIYRPFVALMTDREPSATVQSYGGSLFR